MLCVKWYTLSSAPVQQMASKALHSLSTMVISQQVMHEIRDVVVLRDLISYASQISAEIRGIEPHEYSKSLVVEEPFFFFKNFHFLFPIVLLVSPFLLFSQRCSVR